MKSKAQILVEKIDEMLKERGLTIKEGKKTGSFVYIKQTISKKNNSQK